MSIDLHRVPANYPRKIFHVRHSGADVNKLKRHSRESGAMILSLCAHRAFSGFQQENMPTREGLKNAESAFTGAVGTYVYNYTHRIHLHKKKKSPSLILTAHKRGKTIKHLKRSGVLSFLYL
jgi:hypothetical protein